MKRVFALIAMTLAVAIGCKPEEEIPSSSKLQISLEPSTMNIYEGDSKQIEHTITPYGARDREITWSSSNEEVATVENGLVQAIAAGEAIITATVDKASATCTVYVKTHVSSVAFEKEEWTICVGDTKTLTAIVYPENAMDKSLTWESSAPDYVEVDKNGVVTGKAIGEAKITVTTVDGGFTDECTVYVKPHAESVSLNYKNLKFMAGRTRTLIATVLPDGANDSVIWTSSAEGVASVNEGVVRGISEGTATITVTTEDGGFTDECTVEILPLTEGFSENFDGENFADGAMDPEWTFIDADGDGHNWLNGIALLGGKGYGYAGSDNLLISQSYDNSVGVFYPDNWAFTPGVLLANSNNVISFYMCAQDASFPAEHFAVYVTEAIPTGNDIASGCTELGFGTMTASLPFRGRTIAPRAQGKWYNFVYSVPSNFNGKNVYFGFRHFECSDMFFLDLDEITVYKKEE